MATFGCHSCVHSASLKKYASYELSPCATCKMVKLYHSTHRAALFLSALLELDDDDVQSAFAQATDDIYRDDKKQELIKLNKKIKALSGLKKAIENQIFATTSGIILKLLKMAKEKPIMFEIVIKKMQFPFMAYSEIGQSLNPPCKKQNVLYHLKQAVKMFPLLLHALLTDTRYSSGRYALRTLANKERQEDCVLRLQQLLYGNDINKKAMTLKEIRDIVAAPFNVNPDLDTFDPYIKDLINEQD